MQIVINRWYGGFGLSIVALKRIAELQGKTPRFFTWKYGTGNNSVVAIEHTFEEAMLRQENICVYTDVPPPQDTPWHNLTEQQQAEQNQWWDRIIAPNFDNDRTNPLLVQVVSELGTAANGPCSNLHIVEVPDDVQWTIEDYDGLEHVAEVRRTWC